MTFTLLELEFFQTVIIGVASIVIAVYTLYVQTKEHGLNKEKH